MCASTDLSFVTHDVEEVPLLTITLLLLKLNKLAKYHRSAAGGDVDLAA